MLLILVRSHDALNCRSALQSKLVLLFLLQHQLVHAFFAQFSDLPVFFLSNLLDLIFATLLQLDHVGPHIHAVFVPFDILQSLLL
jgi:hypothetical protein